LSEKENIIEKYPLGVFVGGFRWSGSGAVCDWLGGHEGLAEPEGSDSAYGEIRAVNYGIRYLVLTAAGAIRWGETLGRYAICPDPVLQKKILGPSLAVSKINRTLDLLFTVAARFFITPPLKGYRPLLNAQLGRDFAEDRDYLNAVSHFCSSLRSNIIDKKIDPWRDSKVIESASSVIAVLHKRMCSEGIVPIYNNAFSGLNPELFNLVSDNLFSKKIYILVRRDPRDQFADLVQFSGSTFSWTVGKFINQYKKVQERTARFLEMQNDNSNHMIRLVNFEHFVRNDKETRDKLRDELENFWSEKHLAPKGQWCSGKFKPEESMENIGLYKRAGLTKAIDRIERELSEYLVDI
jgi:hypothetical protein